MSLSGKVDGGGWTVTACARESGAEFDCLIGTSIAAQDGLVVREFTHDQIFSTPQEAVLEGLRAGMSWVGLTTSNTIGVS
ncbi:UDP-glucose 4-epimerase [Paraburkholderia humisilvae]|uniref:Uncharacterized protein n=1 Tax=Paraburkholderia humisilvae TaxID=627669 RepID=A0A6J5F6Q0_9BURK|nr:UDP-glucose 4-epimerase [Paraburkholderia humisilvae]CAB3774043.1 hypothetical protein LMG29542_07565 [Paraburkholderia humisilvae]